jgi:hypothetical protein
MIQYDTAFGSVEQWKSALITLPDTRFFDLMRGVLGSIQSPFNKQRLLDEAGAFLSNKDVQKTITAYIDGADHKVIAAVAALDGPDRRQLASFFSDEYSYAALDSLVLNLEERLILYTANRDGGGRLFLNPLLYTVLLPFAADNSILFPCVNAAREQRPRALFDDVLLAALIAFLSGEKNIFRTDGTPRKPLLQRIERIFPLGGETGTSGETEFFVSALSRLGLISGGASGRSEQRLQDFARLTEAERFSYCAAGVYTVMSGMAAETLITQKDFIRHIALSAAALLDSVDEDKCYTASVLRRLAKVTEGTRGVRRVSPFTDASDTPPLDSALLVRALEKTGLLVMRDGYYRKRKVFGRANIPAITDGRAGENVPVIAFDSFFSFTLLPEITFAGVIALSAFCEVAGAKQSVRFRITRASAARGFNRGISGKAMFELLKKLSGERVKNSLEALLDDWEKTHSEIVIMDGISIVLSEERRYLAQAEPLAPHIVFNPAPGVYMLDFEEKSEAEAALKIAGADSVCEPRAEIKTHFQKKAGPFFVSLAATASCESRHEQATPQSLPERPAECGRLSAGEYKKRFHDLLDGLNFPQAEHGELSARIERKLVVSPRQLSGAFLRYEKREARGLDYAGKLALVKQALLSNETLEIIFQDSDGSEKNVTLAPVTLEKTENGTFLSVKPSGGETGESLKDQVCMKIAMGKIRVIRRIKRSIFSN